MPEIDLNAALAQITPSIIQWGLNVLGAIAFFVAGRWTAGWFRRLTRAAAERGRVDPAIAGFLSIMIYWLVLAFVIIAMLGLFGIPTASFVAIVGAAGLAIGLAFQGTISNFAAGIMLLAFRPIRLGDYVEVGGAAGTVRSIEIFTTALDTPDNVRMIVPNSEIFGTTIKNYSFNATRRIDLIVGVSYDDDLQVASDTILRVLKAEPRVLEQPEPVVAVHEMADSSVNLVARPWVNAADYWATRWDLTRAIKEALETAGCSIPYPQRDVHLFQEAKSA